MTKPIRILAVAAAAVVLVLLTALGARELDRLLTQRMAELKSITIATLEDMAGRRITYADISPSIFQYLEVRNLTIYDSQTPDRELLTVHDIRVYYSLARLLLQRDPVGALREIRILNTRFTLDLDRDRDVLDLLARLARDTGERRQVRARVTGANVTIALRSRDTSLSLRDLFFSIEAQKQAIVVSLRGNVQGELPRGFAFASAVKLQGTLDRSLTASDLTVRLLSFQSSLFTSGSQTLQMVWSGNSVTIRKIQDRSPVTLEVLADLPSQTVTLNFQSEDLRPDRLFTFAPRLAAYRNWLTAPLTASGHLTWHLAAGTLEYEADASLYLEDQLPIHQLTVESSFRGTEKDVFFEPLRLSSPSGALQFDGDMQLSTLSPNGLLTLVDVDAGTGERVSADLSIDRKKDYFEVHGSKLILGEIRFADLSMTVTPVPGGASFSLSTAFEDPRPGDLVQASGSLVFRKPVGRAMREGLGNPLAAPTITLSASMRNIPPQKLYHLISGAGELSPQQRDIYDLLARYSVTADVALSTDLTDVAVISRQVTIAQWDDPSVLVQFGLNADTRHITLTGFSGAWKGFKLEGGFDGRLGSEGQVSFSTSLRFLGTDYAFTGGYSPQSGLQASGSYGLSISAVPRKDGAISLRVKGSRFPTPFPSRTIPVSFDISGIVPHGAPWSVDIASVTVFNFPFLESTTNTLQLTGRLTPDRLEITEASFTDPFSTLDGTATVAFRLPTDLFDSQLLHDVEVHLNATLRSQTGPESYAVTGSLLQGIPSVDIQFAGSPLARVTTAAIKGSLSGKGTVSGTLEHPAVDLSFALAEGRLGTDPLALSGQLSLLEDSLRVRALNVGYLSHTLSDGSGAVDFRKGSYSFAARYKGEYFRDEVQLSVGLDGQFGTEGLDGLFTNPLEHGMTGKLTLGGITVAGASFPSWGIEYRTSAGRLSFDGGPGSSIHGWVDPSLTFSLKLSAPLPISGVAAGRILGDRIAATLDVETLDLLVLNPVLKSPPIPTSAGPFPIINVTSGVATGSVSVQGPVNDPDYSGQLEIVGGGLRSAYSPDEAGPIRTTLIFEGKTFRTPKITAQAGASRLTCTASFTVDHWAPVAFDIGLATEGQAPVRVRARFGRMIADGVTSATLRITGDDKKTSVTGSLVVSDCRITLGDAPPPVKFVPEDVPTFVSMTVDTGRRVEFTWPSDNLPVLHSTASPGGRIAVTYRGDTGAYTVKGSANVQSGEIYYFDRSFIMKKGSITFNEDQDTFDPHITASAEVREWDPNNGEEVKIYLDTDSTLSRFTPRFSSDPARTDSAILAMIGAPIVSKVKTQGLGMAPLVYSDILTQTWILRPFEQKVRQMLNLDLFSIRTQILQNLVAQRIFSPTTVNNPLDALDNTSMSLGKYIGNDLFWEMLVRLQTPQYPTLAALPPGSAQSDQFPTTATIAPGLATPWGFQVDLELSIEWATPFFLMTWSWLPQHPETMFIEDNSLMFSWRFSY